MRVSILKTDGGEHCAADWAVATADRVMDMIQISPDSPRRPGLEAAKRRFEMNVTDILEDHHGRVQDAEHKALAEKNVARLAEPLDAEEHVDEPVAKIIAASKGTLLEDHFAKPELQKELRRLVKSHFESSMDVSRSWHADRILVANPTHGDALAYHRARRNHGPHLVHARIDSYR